MACKERDLSYYARQCGSKLERLARLDRRFGIVTGTVDIQLPGMSPFGLVRFLQQNQQRVYCEIYFDYPQDIDWVSRIPGGTITITRRMRRPHVPIRLSIEHDFTLAQMEHLAQVPSTLLVAARVRFLEISYRG